MSKGKAYEIQVADLAQQLINQGELGIHPKQAKIRHKPAYYSRDRLKDIIFDVSIEVYRKGADTPFLIWIWECKNYSHTIPVDDVEEFHAKINQVGADRTKGTMITPIGFDPGAFEFARSKGIGLWRWIPSGSVTYHTDSDDELGSDEDIIRGLTIASTSGFRFCGFFYGITSDGILTTDRTKLLVQELTDSY